MRVYLEPRAGDGPAPFALGCMNFGKRTPKAESLRLIDHALDAGIGLLDTANAYNDGASEQIVGEALRGRRDAALIATKVGYGRIAGQAEGLSPARIAAACDESRARLGVDVIDLYYLHVPDYDTPLEATLEAVHRLLEAGRIRHWGISNFASWQVLAMRAIAERAGMAGPVVAQQLYNPLVRQLDVEWFKFTRQFPIHTSIYNPLAGGLLAGKLTERDKPPKGSRFASNPMYRRRYWRHALFEAVAALREVADAEGLSLVALAYAFALRHPSVDSVLVGPGTLAHLDDALAAREATLSDDAQRRMRELYFDLVGTDASYAR